MSTETISRLLDSTDRLINGTLSSTEPQNPALTSFVNLIFSNFSRSSAPNFTTIGNTIYFTADDGIHGKELWKSDGTISGTTLVKDINPGLSDGYPTNLVVLNNLLYFTATDGINGTELWRSDGTTEGTVLVKDINLGSAGSSLSQFAIANNTLYFSADDGIHGVELWKTDGTVDGTVLVKDINAGIASSFPGNMTAIDDTLYFSANDGVFGAELWKSDGTGDGTVLVKDINAGIANAFPSDLTAVDGTLYFSANDGIHGVELWTSDGTEAGTMLVQDINPGVASSFPADLIRVGDRLYFNANDGAVGRELWSRDRTTNGVSLVKDINSGVLDSYPDNFTILGDMLYFTTFDTVSGSALWQSNGTSEGRVIDSGANATNVAWLANFGSTLYWGTSGAGDKVNLWRSDGTTDGSTILAAWSERPENIVFPADAGVLNVKDFGAKGDGVTDDTAAIQAALNAYPNGQRIIYLPNGTYLVSDTLSWPAGTPGTGNDYKNTILQGQSERGAIIKLKDSATGFVDTATPKAVVFTGPAPAQRFGNSIRNLTVDTGVGNAGAIGVQFNASNQGSMRQVTIRSGDGQGINGLDMNFADEIGPLLVKDVTINGFQYGIRTGFTVNSQTFEDITLQNQSVYGLYNTGQILNIRGLTSTNAVTAIYNAGGRVTILDSTLNGTGAATNQPAIRSDFPLDLVVRNISTTGYQAAIQNAGDTLPGPNIPEFVSGSIASQFQTPLQTLNLPIKETPDVPWDNPTTTPWANIVAYGAIPNDGLDDTAAIQAAIDSGKTTVYLPVGNYNLQNTVFVRNNVRRILGTEATVQVPETVNPGFKIVDGTSPTVVIERIQSGFSSTPTVENASSRTLVIRDATNVAGNMTGSGDVFIENVVSNPFQSWTFNQQNVWARQFNVENQGTHVINNGGNLWIFGFKTERGGTLIDTRSGGKTELLGGLAYTTTNAPDGTQNDPMFISNALGEVNYGGGSVYTTYFREIRDGVTRDLPASSLTNYIGSGKHIPLYVGYTGN